MLGATGPRATYAGLKDDLADGGRVRVVEAKSSEDDSLNRVGITIDFIHRKHLEWKLVAFLNGNINSDGLHKNPPSPKDLPFPLLQGFAN